MAADREQACAPALNCAAAGGLLAIGCSLRGGFDFISHCEDFFILYFFGLFFQPKGYKHKQLFFLLQTIKKFSIEIKYFKTFNNGSLGSRIDEERSEMRYVM